MFFFFLRKFSLRTHERELWPKKVYLADTGLSKSYGVEESIGKLMENAVFLDLMRRRSYWHPQWDLFYFKDYQHREVDFLVKEGPKIRELIQVTYATEKDEVEKREIRSLIKASELTGCKNLSIITWDYEDIEVIEGKEIRFTPLWKWLLEV